jgi:hypothetical protein
MNLTQGISKFSSCDFPSKIPVNSNTICLECFSSSIKPAKIAEFCPTCAWFTLLLGPNPPLAHPPVFLVCLATSSLK